MIALGALVLVKVYSISSTSNQPESLLLSLNSITSDDFELARKESDGFFDDVPSHHWKLLKEKVKAMSPNYNIIVPPIPEWVQEGHSFDNRNKKAGWFYQNHYEPDFVCQHERRVGFGGDGGKWICDPHRIANQSSCLVYSVGSNNDFSFEEHVFSQISTDCEIHTFDFGDYAAGAEKAGVHYHQVGMGLDATEGNKVFKSLATIIQELGHEGQTIDIFKIDCEGCEWTTAAKWMEANVTLRQIQVELHGAKIPETAQFFETMYANNYVITHKEPNIAYGGGSAIEYALLKLTPQFFEGIERKELPDFNSETP